VLLTIVIPTYNRCQTLERLLKHLELQTDPQFQVVVAMDGCADRSREMLEGIRVSYELKWLDTECNGYGLAVARNRAILAADGDLVAIIDDDSFPVPGYVAAYKQSARRDTITAGPRTPSDSSDERQLWKMQELGKLPAREPLTIEKLRSNYPSAVTTECNICMYREDIIRMGLFSERMKIYGFIGQEFFERARHLDVKYQYDPEAETIHDRQHEGPTGLSDGRKKREIMVARAVRPAFMTPAQFTLQQKWAVSLSERGDYEFPLPPFPVEAIALFPYRFLRNRMADLRRALRARRTEAQ
jgi:glycosyltransferase involved in cell wall biosynthesis